ncbi:MAG: ABC transporter ATP-binding protein [Pseudomonadota bacterium]
MNLRQLIGFAAPYRNTLAVCGALMLVESMVTLAIPGLGGAFAQQILTAGSSPASLVLLSLLALFAAQGLIRYANGLLLGRTSAHILADLRIRVYDHLQALPLNFHHQRRQGDLMALLAYDAERLSNYLTGTLLSVVPLLVTVLGAAVLMARLDPGLAAMVTLLVPLFYLVLRAVGRRLRPLAQEIQAADAKALAIAQENIGMLPALKTFTREAVESARYGMQIGELRQLSIAQHRIFAALEPAVQFITAAGVVLLLWLANTRIGAGQMSPAELVSFLLYAAVLARPVASLALLYGQTQVARGTLTRLQEVLTERPESVLQATQTTPRFQGEIEFRNVQFSYPGRTPALAGLNLQIRAGEVVALTGENGAGKSTLAHLLLRLHEPTAGQIFLDGIDIATCSLHGLRSQVGIVAQHVLLFNGTVGDNIGFGRPDVDAAAIKRAATAAQAHEFISQLPLGYDTVIGDQGIRLSGGQRQRVALARALLKDPAILVLDEATSMFDPHAEDAFISECQKAFEGRTVILITHRPASLALADRVLKLEQGRISESAQAARPAAVTAYLSAMQVASS